MFKVIIEPALQTGNYITITIDFALHFYNDSYKMQVTINYGYLPGYNRKYSFEQTKPGWLQEVVRLTDTLMQQQRKAAVIL